MRTGIAVLILSDGRTPPLSYQFGGDYDETRAGILLCDTSNVGPTALHARLRVIRKDGTEILVTAMHSSDRYLAVTGRVAPSETT